MGGWYVGTLEDDLRRCTWQKWDCDDDPLQSSRSPRQRESWIKTRFHDLGFCILFKFGKVLMQKNILGSLDHRFGCYKILGLLYAG